MTILLNRILFTNITCMFSIAMVGCAPETESGKEEIIRPSEPQRVLTDVDNNRISVSWDVDPAIDEYELYYSTDPAFEVKNYAAYANGALVLNKIGSYSFDVTNRALTYYFAVVAVKDQISSPPAKGAWATTRFEIVSPSNDRIIDHANNLIWDRCPIGMSWNIDDRGCSGSPTEFNYSEALTEMASRTSRLAMPSEYKSLAYCIENSAVTFLEYIDGSTSNNNCHANSELNIDFVGQFFDLPTKRAYMSGHTYYSSGSGIWVVRTVSLADMYSFGAGRDSSALSVYILPVENYTP